MRRAVWLGVVACGATVAIGIPHPASAGEHSDVQTARSVVLAYIHAERRGDWKTVCSLKTPAVLRAAGGSVDRCAKSYPALLNAGTGFLGFIRRGTATVRALSTRQAGPDRAEVFVLWRVWPWRRDVVQLYRMDRVSTGVKAGPYRVSEERWATKQGWPPPKQ
jgi:hypothetical protein